MTSSARVECVSNCTDNNIIVERQEKKPVKQCFTEVCEKDAPLRVTGPLLCHKKYGRLRQQNVGSTGGRNAKTFHSVWRSEQKDGQTTHLHERGFTQNDHPSTPNILRLVCSIRMKLERGKSSAKSQYTAVSDMVVSFYVEQELKLLL